MAENGPKRPRPVVNTTQFHTAVAPDPRRVRRGGGPGRKRPARHATASLSVIAWATPITLPLPTGDAYAVAGAWGRPSPFSRPLLGVPS